MSHTYNENSVKTLEFLEAVRTKLAMYVGSADNQAVHHILKEIISNAIDEYLAGYGHRIEIILYPNNSISVRDYGRGIPFGSAEKIFTVAHTSGKFDKQEGAAYGTSGGLNGIGLKTATATGQAHVRIFKDKEVYVQTFSFEKGTSEPEILLNKGKEKNGTFIKWQPDEEPFFGDNLISKDKVIELLEDLSYVVPGLVFSFKEHGKEEVVISAKNIADFLKDYIAAHDMISPVMSFKAGDKKLAVEGAFVWSKKTSLEQAYVNLIPTCDGGTHVTALKATLTREINKRFNCDLKGDEIRRGLSFILSVKMIEEPKFKGQSKDALNMPTANAPLSALMREEIVEILEREKKFFEKLVAMIEELRKKSNVEQILKKLTSGKKKEKALSDVTKKYKGCSNETDIELFLTEGDSAAGGLHLTKSPINQAVYALRGKILNTFNKDLEEVLMNEEIKSLIEILGSEREALKKFSKVVLTADADVDGKSITVLALGFIAKFYPRLLTEGRIHVPVLPLYSAMSPKGEKKFFMTEEELSKVPKSWDISYLKGLGEMNPAELGLFTVKEKSRTLIKIDVTEENFEEFYGTLELALSKEAESVSMRRELLI